MATEQTKHTPTSGTVCSHCEETRNSRCSYADCPFDVDQSDIIIAAQSAELSRLRNSHTALVEALEPFGDVCGEGDEDFPDETKVVVKFGRSTHYALTLGDFRRAARALSAEGEKDAPKDEVRP